MIDLASSDKREFQDLEPIEEMYDTSPEAGDDGLYGLELNDGLTETEIKLAPMYAMFRNGLLIVTGSPGAGKGVFSNHLAWKVRRLFKNRKILLDYQPRKTFDLGYEDNRYKLFTWDFLQKQIGNMAIQSGTVKLENADSVNTEDGNNGNDENKKLTKDKQEAYALAVKKWRRQNEVLMQNCVMVLDEFKRYVHNRQPTAKINITFGNIISVWRHLNMLILGMCPNINEIDYNSALYYMTHHVKCSWCEDRKNSTRAKFYRKKSVSANGVVNVEKKPFVINIDGRKPRPEIEVALQRPELAFGVPEKRIVEVLKIYKGIANLNMIAEMTGEELNECSNRLISMHGNWIENDNLEKEFNNIVRCKGYFDLYNSQNFANLNVKTNSMSA